MFDNNNINIGCQAIKNNHCTVLDFMLFFTKNLPINDNILKFCMDAAVVFNRLSMVKNLLSNNYKPSDYHLRIALNSNFYDIYYLLKEYINE